jgi:predicted RNase H-like HicB family nuclease
MVIGTIILTLDKGGYVVSVPAPPGCHTEGDPLDEAVSIATKPFPL